MRIGDTPTIGTVTYREQFSRCGKAECRRCAPGNKGHGPYWYAYWREGGRLRSRYVGKQPPAELLAQAAAHQAAPNLITDPELARYAPADMKSTLPSLQVRTLGRFAVWRGSEPIPPEQWKRRKAAMLFLLLLSAPQRRLHREQAADLLWPDNESRRATTNLRALLHTLRKILDPWGRVPGYVHVTGEWLILEPAPHGEPIVDWWDAAAFSQAAEAALKTSSTRLCRDALALYAGDYLEEYIYDDSISAFRESLRHLRIALLLHLAELLAAEDELPDAVLSLEDALHAEPYREDVARLLMRLLAASGQRTRALRVYQQVAEALQQELAVEPEEETSALRDSLLHGGAAVDHQESVPFPRKTVQPPVDALLAGPAPTPLVGRQTILACLTDRLRSAQGGAGNTVLLRGAAGAGKSRILAEFLRSAWAEGALVLSGRAYHAEGRLPYGPILDALRGYMVAQAPSFLAPRLGAHGPALLTLFPESAHILPTVSSHMPLDPLSERHRLLAALAGLFGVICAGGTAVLALDDLHWTDPTTLETLHFLARTCRDLPLLIIGSYRHEEMDTGSLSEILAGIGAQPSVTVLDIASLSETESDQLAAAVLAPFPLDRAVAQRIRIRGQGNPLAVEELALAMRESGEIAVQAGSWILTGLTDTPVPPKIRSLLLERVALLDEQARRFMQLCAVLTDRLTYDVLRALSGLDENTLLDTLERLATTGLLVETTTGYRFHHPLLGEALYQSISAPRRMSLHRTVAQGLVRYYGAQADLPAGILAFHFGQAGEREEAGRYALLAADQAAAGYANHEALEYLLAARGYLLGGPGNEKEISRVDERMGDLHRLIGRFAAAEDDYRRARLSETEPGRLADLWRKEGATWEERGRYGQAFEAYDRAAKHAENVVDGAAILAGLAVSRGAVLYRQGNYGDAATAGRSALAALHGATSLPIAARASNLLGNVARATGDYRTADRRHRQALAVWARLPEHEQDAQAILGGWGNRGITAYIQGNLAEAERYHLRSLEIAERIGDQRAVAYSWYNLAVIFADRGELAEAEAYQRRSLAVRELLEDRFNTAFSLESLGKIAHLRGDLSEADQYYQQALAVLDQIGAMGSTVQAICRRAEVAGDRGDFQEARKLIHQAHALGCRTHAPAPNLPFVRAALYLRMASTTPSGPTPRLLRAAAEFLARGTAWAAAHHTSRYAAEAALLTTRLHLLGGDVGSAQAVAEEAGSLADVSGRRRESALARRLLGECAAANDRREEGIAYLRAAQVSLESMGAELEAARTGMALAVALTRSARNEAPPPADQEEAQRLRAWARKTFAAVGARLDLQAVQQ